MNLARVKRRLIKAIRLYPILALAILALAYFLGAFTEQEDPLVPQSALITGLYLFVGLVPLLFIIGLIILGGATDREFKRMGSKREKLLTSDPFLLPKEEMFGYKLALITDRPPTLTGLTGDSYRADDAASCDLDPSHIPPVLDCECGFYAYKEFDDAKFELTLNPGCFLIDVDLFGIGFIYKRGFRAESQMVKKLHLPKRCMRCHIFPAKVFVSKYKLGYSSTSWWQWQIYCQFCSRGFKAEHRLEIAEMIKALAIK